MFQKMITVIILTFAFLMASAQELKIDHSSRESLMVSFWEAMGTRNGDLLWKLVPPKYQNHPKAAMFKNGFVNSSMQSFPEELSKNVLAGMKDPEIRKNLIQNGIEEFKSNLVQIDGKWYLNFFKPVGSMASVKIPPKPAAIDHSSKTKVQLSLLLGIYYEDDELVWNAFSPEFRGNRKAGKGFAKAVAKTIPREALISAIKTLSSGEVTLEHIQMNTFQCIETNGKWYISPVVKK